MRAFYSPRIVPPADAGSRPSVTKLSRNFLRRGLRDASGKVERL
jgi:hypothetical protein